MTCNFHKVSSNNDIDTVAAVIESCLYVCVYISPQTPWANVETFFSDMLQECTQVLKPNHNLLDIIFLGDFNATNHKERLVELFERFGLNQHVDSPTHRDGNVLDMIFTHNKKPLIVTMPVFFSDHFFVGAAF